MGGADSHRTLIHPASQSSGLRMTSGKRTMPSSRMSMTCATRRWLSGWRMSRRPSLAQILEILMAERAKDLRAKEQKLLEDLIKKHEELIPTVSKTQVMVDLYWKCYAYGDELKPHIEFLDGIMLSSTRDIAPSCVENVDEL